MAEAFLVNSAQAKNVSGKKSYVSDCLALAPA